MARTFLIAEKIDYQLGARRGFLFDTNIWLDLNPPMPVMDHRDKRRQERYGKLLKAILTAGHPIARCDTVLSEYVNRFIRAQYDLWCQTSSGTLKEWRSCQDYRDMASGLSDELHHTMGCCVAEGWTVPSIDLDAAGAALQLGEFDFNDYLLAEFCRVNDLVLVTHDKDFAAIDVDVVTANRRLVSARN